MVAVEAVVGETLSDASHGSKGVLERNVEAGAVGADRERIGERREAVLRIAGEPGDAEIVGEAVLVAREKPYWSAVEFITFSVS